MPTLSWGETLCGYAGPCRRLGLAFAKKLVEIRAEHVVEVGSDTILWQCPACKVYLKPFLIAEWASHALP